jgi:hypothetical protein
MDRDQLIQRIEEVKFLKFRSAASLGRGFMRRAVPVMRHARRTSQRAQLFARGMRQHIGAAEARKFAKTIAYKAATPGRAGPGGYGKAYIKDIIAQGARGRERMLRHGKALAPTVGAGIVLTGATVKGVRAYKQWRQKQKEKTRFRNIAVYPEHGYAAVGIQPYNQPYYNEPERSGPPSHQRARIGGVFERDELINNIVEAVFNT